MKTTLTVVTLCLAFALSTSVNAAGFCTPENMKKLEKAGFICTYSKLPGAKTATCNCRQAGKK